MLILGGTGEARALAAALVATRRSTSLSSLAGRVADPVLPPGEVRIGGFGGAAGPGRLAGASDRARRRRRRDPPVRRADDRLRRRGSRGHRRAAAAAAAAGLDARDRATTGAGSTRWPRRRRRWPGSAHGSSSPPAGRGLAAFAGLTACGSWSARSTRRRRRCRPAMQLLLDRGPFTSRSRSSRCMREHRVDVVVTKDSGGSADRGQAGRRPRARAAGGAGPAARPPPGARPSSTASRRSWTGWPAVRSSAPGSGAGCTPPRPPSARVTARVVRRADDAAGSACRRRPGRARRACTTRDRLLGPADVAADHDHGVSGARCSSSSSRACPTCQVRLLDAGL